MIFVSHFKKSIIIMMLCSTPIISRSCPTSLTGIAVCIACPAIGVAALAKEAMSWGIGAACATAPWIEWLTDQDIQVTKTFFETQPDAHSATSYKGPIIVHLTGCADHYQSHKNVLETINKETKQPVIAVNYSKKQRKLDSLAKQTKYDLMQELKIQNISPTKITFVGHSIGGAISDVVAEKIEKELNMENEKITVIAFSSFNKLEKILKKIPERLFYYTGWGINPKGKYKTHVIEDEDDTFMTDSPRTPTKGGKVIKVKSESNHHLNWEAVDRNGRRVPLLISDLINEDADAYPLDNDIPVNKSSVVETLENKLESEKKKK